MSLPDRAFWAGRRVLLTGHTGFKGGWLARWLVALGARVHGYSERAGRDPSPFVALDVAAAVESTFGDVRDGDALRAAMLAARPEIVLHLAARPLVLQAFRDPVATFEVNVMGTVRVLDAVRAAESVAAVVVVTTDKVYAERDDRRPYAEGDRLGGAEPYGASKACAELVVDAYRASYLRARGIAVATARAGNVIGGADWSPDRLIPDVVAALAAGRRLELRNPEATRPWQHVLEPLAGYLLLAERLVADAQGFERAWNFGPRQSGVATVGSVVARVEQAWGASVQTAAPPAGPHEAAALALDSSDTMRLLHWSPRLNLDQAIRWTVEWYTGFAAGRSGADIADDQIVRYAAAAAPDPPAVLR